MIARLTNGGGGGAYSSSSSGDQFDLKTLGIVGIAGYLAWTVIN